MKIFRTPDDRFAGLPEFPFQPHYQQVEVDGTALRMHYLDEGIGSRGVMLMLHGMPTWSYLYRRMIPPLVEAGFRCVAPDHIGFGRSDKVLDDRWYSIDRHGRAMKALVEALDLKGVTLVCQDWGGPIGLRQVVDTPARFGRLAIMNTWLHHTGYEYTPNIRMWQSLWKPGGRLLEEQACGFVMRNFLANFPGDPATDLTPDEIFAAYEAPFPDAASKAGPRRFPLSIPIDDDSVGNAPVQEADFEALKRWTGPAHFIWGARDLVFTEAWGREWAALIPGATFGTVNAGHFLQETHGAEVSAILLRRIDEEGRNP
ncbi:MAG: alpha/beta fold hydrolase [Chloroflexi bacterium]|nr:alpha/beta fold hydrolase [Chloroflexota bacterium]